MKVLNKILPISLVGLTSFTPFICSCSQNSFKFTANDFVYDVGFKGGTLKLDDATNTYLTDINKNKKIFAEDFAAYYVGQLMRPDIFWSFKISNITVDLASSRLGYKISMHQDKSWSTELDHDLEININKLKYRVVNNGTTTWKLELDDDKQDLQDYLSIDKNWKIEIVQKWSSKHGGVKKNYSFDSSNIKDNWNNFLDYSYNFQIENITYLSKTDIQE